MAKKTYRLLEQAHEAGQRTDDEVGTEFEDDLDPDTERAMIAAGWIEPVQKEDTKAKGGKK